jgi:hypothetical protein
MFFAHVKCFKNDVSRMANHYWVLPKDGLCMSMELERGAWKHQLKWKI